MKIKKTKIDLSDGIKILYNGDIPIYNYYDVEIKKHQAGRTTGYKSQNHLVNGCINQICDYTGYSHSYVKEYAKILSISYGYPTERGFGDSIIPVSEIALSNEHIKYFLCGIFDLADMIEIKLVDDYGLIPDPRAQ